MKPTSLIYLALAVMLIIGGFISCKIAYNLADKQGISIFEQTKDEDGDLVFKYDINDNNISSLSLIFNNVNVEIHSTEEQSYISLENFKVNDYSVTLSGSSLKVDGTVSFFESLLDRSKGGFSFRGMRYFFSEKPESGKERKVDIYISSTSKLNSLSVDLNGGNLNISDLENPLDYGISLTKGDVSLKGISSISIADISITDGSLNISESFINTISAKVTNGDVKITSDGRFDSQSTTYNLISTSGSIIYNGSVVEDNVYKITSANQKCNISVSVTNGNTTIRDNAE